MNHTAMIIIGFSIIFVANTLGSGLVYLFKGEISQKLNTILLGFAAGVMIAASIWSLLIPAIDQSSGMGKFSVVPVAIGFLLGGGFLLLLDKIIPHFHSGLNEEEGIKNSLGKSTKLFLAVMIHNIPEGLAVGFAFGAASAAGTDAAYISALGLAIGIAIQNFPEGAAVSLPIKNATSSRSKAFLYGTASGAVEPIAAIAGYFLTAFLTLAQPWFLSFAAGAMIFVVAEDLIPDSKIMDYPHLGAMGVMSGFVIMMILEIVLG